MGRFKLEIMGKDADAKALKIRNSVYLFHSPGMYREIEDD